LAINGQKVFLSGPNIAWQSYGYDFGNGMYDVNGGALESMLQSISDNGGNSVSKSQHYVNIFDIIKNHVLFQVTVISETHCLPLYKK
jgi:hypothetical protein